MFIPFNTCQKVSQSPVSKPSRDPLWHTDRAHAAPTLRFQMCSGLSLWWNPSSPGSGLLISGLFILLNVSMGECDITSDCRFWHTDGSMWTPRHGMKASALTFIQSGSTDGSPAKNGTRMWIIFITESIRIISWNQGDLELPRERRLIQRLMKRIHG